MATKRPFSAIHPSRASQVPHDPDSEPRHKRQKPENLTGKKSFKKAHTVNDLKSRIRSLKRLLEHNDDLPPKIRIEKERALRSAQQELGREEQAKKRSDLIGKWHKVRFFERQKATKRLKRARKEVEAAGGEEGEGEGVEDLKRKVREAEVDVNYAVYFPLDMEYVPLFAKKKRKRDGGRDGEREDESPETEGAEVERQGDAVMWEKVRQCMEDGTLEALRNGKLTPRAADGDAETEQAVEKATAKLKKDKRQKKEDKPPAVGNRRERRKAAAAAPPDSDRESEGGFFE